MHSQWHISAYYERDTGLIITIPTNPFYSCVSTAYSGSSYHMSISAFVTQMNSGLKGNNDLDKGPSSPRLCSPPPCSPWGQVSHLICALLSPGFVVHAEGMKKGRCTFIVGFAFIFSISKKP